MKYIVVTGGVISGLGKGITISSIGRILKSANLRVTAIKIDPYLNTDAGTMSPFEHGETFILDDGGETDLDLGNYERFLDVTLTARHNITSGKIYKEVISRERRGDYLGKTVQMVPHVTDLVQSWIREVARIPVDGSGKSPDVCLIEVGGTVGDIESMVFLEALRQFQFIAGLDNIMFIHISLVPILGGECSGEQKSKPTQHSVKELRALGLSPDVIICRSSEIITHSTKQKISTFCHVSISNIFCAMNVPNIYHVPLILFKQGIHTVIKNRLQLNSMSLAPSLSEWQFFTEKADELEKNPGAKIAFIGKYIEHEDSYLSLILALKHSAVELGKSIEIVFIESSDLELDCKTKTPEVYEKSMERLHSCHGVLVPGGFGVRGVSGKIAAVKFAREHKIPCLGICLGMQVMAIEFAQNVLGLSEADSMEFDESTAQPVVIFMPEINQSEKGGTMRLGSRETTVSIKTPCGQISQLYRIYRKDDFDHDVFQIRERHRHRYEVNPEMIDKFEAEGMYFTGRDELRMEVLELSESLHPFYMGVQFHPEMKSRPMQPSPVITAFLKKACQFF